MSEGNSILNLPKKDVKNELGQLGISESHVNPFQLYDIFKEVPQKDRGNFRILFACTGGSERSRMFGAIAVEMGFDVANIANPKGYHSRNAIPVDELVEPSYEATFPDGDIKFSNINKPINYLVIFSNEKMNPRGEIELQDHYTSRIINGISTGLLKSSQETKTQPEGVTFITVPSMEKEVKQIERLFLSEQ